jgi:hypothetical protein
MIVTIRSRWLLKQFGWGIYEGKPRTVWPSAVVLPIGFGGTGLSATVHNAVNLDIVYRSCFYPIFHRSARM